LVANIYNNIDWTGISALVAVMGVFVSAFTFWKSFSKLKETEQIKIVCVKH